MSFKVVCVCDMVVGAQEYPDDFRGALARGVYLRNNKKEGDAQRMFMQARFLAPPDVRGVVERIINQ